MPLTQCYLDLVGESFDPRVGRVSALVFLLPDRGFPQPVLWLLLLAGARLV